MIDEACSQLAPLVRRTWAPRGRPPVLKHAACFRAKVSLMGALTLSPRRGRLGFYCDTMRQGDYDDWTVAWFLRQLLRHLRGPILLLWDQVKIHQGPAVRALRQAQRRLQIVDFPAYTPDLNVVEQVWSYLKWGKLSNATPANTLIHEKHLGRELSRIRTDQRLLRQLWKGSTLPLPPWLRTLAS
jgi:transposase